MSKDDNPHTRTTVYSKNPNTEKLLRRGLNATFPFSAGFSKWPIKFEVMNLRDSESGGYAYHVTLWLDGKAVWYELKIPLDNLLFNLEYILDKSKDFFKPSSCFAHHGDVESEGALTVRAMDTYLRADSPFRSYLLERHLGLGVIGGFSNCLSIYPLDDYTCRVSVRDRTTTVHTPELKRILRKLLEGLS